MFYFDRTYILVLIGMVISLWASASFKSNMSRYSKVNSSIGLTAAEAAKQILSAYDITNVRIKMIDGVSSDYYDTRNKELCLLSSNYNSTSIAAIGVAAHECGHAIQDATGYKPLVLKNTIAPVCSISSNIGIYIVLAGLLFQATSLFEIGIVLFSLGVFVTLLLLPIEFDASNRALKILEDSGLLLEGEEIRGARKVLRSAGMTYVAAAAASVLSLLRLLILFGGNNRNR